MTPRIVHIIGRFLGRSETFIYDMIGSIPGFEHHVLTTRTENLDRFPFDNLIVTPGEEHYATHVARLQAAAIVCHFGPSGLTGLVPGLSCGVPVVTVFYGFDASMLLRDAAWIERYQALFRFGAHVVCVSEAMRARLVAVGCPDERASTVHLGIDLERFTFWPRRTRQPGEPLRLLVMSRLSEKKGIPVVLRALRRVIDAGIAATLRIGGEGEDEASLTALWHELGLEAHATFIGPRDRSQVRDELRACDVLLQVSVVASNGDEEGIPVVLSEAMASGVPVIATRHAGIPELVEHERTGLLVGEHDVEATAEAISRLARDSSLGPRLAPVARAHVDAEFNLVHQGRRNADLLRRVIAEYRRPEPSLPVEGRQRLLFVRSVPVPIALSKLVVLRHRYPEAELWVLTRADSADVFNQCPLVSRVLTFPPGRMNLASIAPAVLAEVRDAGLACVIVPVADEGTAPDNVVRVAEACGASRVAGLNPRNEDVPVTAGDPS